MGYETIGPVKGHNRRMSNPSCARDHGDVVATRFGPPLTA